jgi:hypothetical protein
LAACRTAPKASQAPLKAANASGAPIGSEGALSIGDMERASKLYITKCARCHKLYDPSAYTDPTWQSWMAKMGRKAKLQPEQTELLSRYIEVALRRPRRE